MRHLKFHFLKASNFLCYGKEGIEVSLKDHGNIIYISGRNLDVNDDEDAKKASNGVGKSTIPDIIVYALYGKTVRKKASHQDIINNKNGGKLYTEVIWDKYRVVRTRKPDSLKLWESESHEWNESTEITLGGMPATQELIEEKIGLSYEVFLNIVIFTDDSRNNFLECDAPDKRKIVDNLLSLSQYREYSEIAKEKKKELKTNLEILTKEYNKILLESDMCKSRIQKIKSEEESWKSNKKQEIKKLIENIKEKQSALGSSDNGLLLNKYNEAQEKIKMLQNSLTECENNSIKIKQFIEKKQKEFEVAREEKSKYYRDCDELKSIISRSNIEKKTCGDNINSFTKKVNSKCPSCFGVVKEENFTDVIKSLKEKINSIDVELSGLTIKLNEKSALLSSKDEESYKIKSTLTLAEDKNTTLNKNWSNYKKEINELSKIQRPQANIDERILLEQIDEIKNQAKSKQKELENSPFVIIIKNAEDELVEKTQETCTKKKELDAVDGDLPYYDFWVGAFGDSGIRKFVIDGILPALNSNISYWLQYLVDGKIKLTFDNELNENIEKIPSNGNSFIYHLCSGGQKRRINLAISQAFAHVMMLSSGKQPSIVFLDEVATNMDVMGVWAIYNMIVELSKDKQVFVTTHDKDLIELLSSNSSKIELEMKNQETKILSKK